MKKLVGLLLVFLLCLSIAGCGKSEAVKNVEAMIEGLGEITVESIDAIRAAEEAYGALTPEEQGKVKNIETLSAARDRYYELVLVGNWTDPYIYTYGVAENYSKRVNLTLNPDMTGTDRGDGDTEFPCTWSVTGGILKISADEGYWTDYEVQEKDGQIILQSSGSNWYLMRLEDYHALLDDIFLIVDMEQVNPADYFGFRIHEDIKKNEWGEPNGISGTYVLLENLLYEAGWMYLECSENFAVEVLHPEYQETYVYPEGGSSTYTREAGSVTITWSPFASFAFSVGWKEPVYTQTADLTEDQLAFGRARGTLTFINRNYVAEVRKSDGANDRILIPTFGYGGEIYTGIWMDGIEY